MPKQCNYIYGIDRGNFTRNGIIREDDFEKLHRTIVALYDNSRRVILGHSWRGTGASYQTAFSTDSATFTTVNTTAGIDLDEVRTVASLGYEADTRRRLYPKSLAPPGVVHEIALHIFGKNIEVRATFPGETAHTITATCTTANYDWAWDAVPLEFPTDALELPRLEARSLNTGNPDELFCVFLETGVLYDGDAP